MRPFITLLFTAAALLAEDYKAAPGGAPPAELAASVSALLHKEGTRVMKDGQLLAEVWYRSEVPAGPASTEANLTISCCSCRPPAIRKGRRRRRLTRCWR